MPLSKKILITGATDGVGKECAKSLAKMGHHIILVGRSREKTKLVASEIKAESNNQQIEYHISNLELMKQVNTLSEEISAQNHHIDILINNAGAWFQKREETEEGLEKTFALNHLSYFLLSHRVLPLLKKSKSPRIINVASQAHRWQKINFSDLQSQKTYQGFKVYSKTKLMNIMFTYSLARALSNKYSVSCLHPGFVASKFGHNNEHSFSLNLFKMLQKVSAISTKKGAETTIFLATKQLNHLQNGLYFSKSKPLLSSVWSYRKSDQNKLWEASVQIIKDITGYNCNLTP